MSNNLSIIHPPTTTLEYYLCISASALAGPWPLSLLIYCFFLIRFYLLYSDLFCSMLLLCPPSSALTVAPIPSRLSIPTRIFFFLALRVCPISLILFDSPPVLSNTCTVPVHRYDNTRLAQLSSSQCFSPSSPDFHRLDQLSIVNYSASSSHRRRHLTTSS